MKEETNPFEELLGSFSKLTEKDSATVVIKDSGLVSLTKLIHDVIYGLLSEPELSPQQLALLRILLEGRKMN